jgi:superfamily I DNA/RNA helicase/RecB family exonuclease
VSLHSASARLATLSAEQASILADWTGPTLVVGPPGTGKTTLLAWAAIQELRAGGPPPLVLAGDRAAASRLRNAITVELGEGSWRPQVLTVHALARSLWQRFSGRAEVRLLSAPEQEFRVRELLAGAGAGRWPTLLAHAYGTRGFAAQVRAALARARQLGMEPEDVAAVGAAVGRDDWVALGGFFTEYLDVLDAEQVLDYAELVHRARLLVADPGVVASLAEEFAAVLIDDVTELDPAQLGLVATLGRGAKVLATADPDSVSATFRGADPHAVRTFAESFSGPDREAVVVALRTVHRHGAAMTEALAAVRARLPRPVGMGEFDVRSAAESAGEVVVLECADLAAQARAIVTELRRARLIDGTEFRQMAVLTRSGRAQAEAIRQALAADQIPVTLPADEIPLAQAPAVRALLTALAVARADRVDPVTAEQLLTSPLGGFDPVSLRVLARQWRARPGADGQGRSLGDEVAQALNDVTWAESGQGGPQTRKLLALARLLDQTRVRLEQGAAVDELLWQLWRGTDWPARLAKEAVGGGTSAGRADADLDALCALFETAAESDRRGGPAGVRAFLAELEGQHIPADRQRESRLEGRGVSVLTAHRARGREWELVVVAGVQEGSWPVGRRVHPILDASELSPIGLIGVSDPREVLAAERRLFHLACSRARRRLIVTATAGTEGENDAPSRFLAELGVPRSAPVAVATPVSLTGVVVELRRAATSAAVSPTVRAIAAAQLATIAELVDDQGRPLAAAARPEHWWGVREPSSGPPTSSGEIRLSPSQVSSLLDCPRRYFLDRRAGGDGRRSTAMALGSLIHAVIQSVVQEGWDLERAKAEVARAWPQLEFETDWQSRHQRQETERGLERFFFWWQRRTAELVGVEVAFELPLVLDGLDIVLAGKVDWLERSPDGCWVVDFKTGKRAPTAAEVAELDQLGIYQLAAQVGALGDVGLPQGASVAYLRLGGRPDDLPKQLDQASLVTRPHLTEGAAEAYPTWVHQRVAAAARVVAEGRYPALPGDGCRSCAFAVSCPAVERGRQVIR